ncbi:MAG: STAS domain-containing protein [Akkermansiaceae bacterium]|nr:STAS domain-containing protein [Akkermansiaceae bacterium]
MLKEWCEREINNGAICIVVDLAACKGMDSTFMGTMAGLAMRLMKIPDGRLQVAEPGERNRKSLEDLGLDVLMQIDPIDASWRGKMEDVRAKLETCEMLQEKIDHAPHVLEAHQQLCEADSSNTQKFGTVLDFLEAEVKAKEAAKR